MRGELDGAVEAVVPAPGILGSQLRENKITQIRRLTDSSV